MTALGQNPRGTFSQDQWVVDAGVHLAAAMRLYREHCPSQYDADEALQGLLRILLAPVAPGPAA